MINKLHPLTITQKLNETAEFYKNYFEFKEVFTSDWYIQLAHKSGSEMAIMLPDLPNQPAFLHKAHAGGGIAYTFETKDATAAFQKLKDADAPIIYELKDEEWGQRHFILEDPAGVYVDVVQYL
ncbi:MAG TPA: VOC family protein [Candidatus Saccharimonadales bacterium]|nr:VOC family protein [Candidatus Saccharimonadales bacterium]